MNANSKPPAPAINTWLDSAIQQLATIPSARLDAELMLAHCLEVDRPWLLAHGETLLQGPTLQQANKLLKKRQAREPLAYLLGYKEFYGRKFIVTPDVLIPRPESEMMIDLLKELPLPRYAEIVDVGTGSGCLGLTAKLECPHIKDVILSDISEKALTVAKRNNRTFFHSTKVQYYVSNLLDAIPGENDAILANLPYVDRGWERSPETDHEPALALFADDDGLALIKRLIEQSPRALKAGGYLLLEADPEQHQSIITHANANGLRLETVRDYIVVLQKS